MKPETEIRNLKSALRDADRRANRAEAVWLAETSKRMKAEQERARLVSDVDDWKRRFDTLLSRSHVVVAPEKK